MILFWIIIAIIFSRPRPRTAWPVLGRRPWSGWNSGIGPFGGRRIRRRLWRFGGGGFGGGGGGGGFGGFGGGRSGGGGRRGAGESAGIPSSGFRVDVRGSRFGVRRRA